MEETMMQQIGRLLGFACALASFALAASAETIELKLSH
jgi:hypothetical protein